MNRFIEKHYFDPQTKNGAGLKKQIKPTANHDEMRNSDKLKAAPAAFWRGAGGRWAYALLFTLVIPAGLALWCARIPTGKLPSLQSSWAGIFLAGAGIALMAAGSLALWRRGKGLPMNAFPPARLVRDGVYGLLPHPIYCGFVAAVAGCALWSGSAAGLWLGAPLSALLCAALVTGYEKPYLMARFGQSPQPLMGPPPAECEPSFARSFGAATAVMLPWLLSCYAFKALGATNEAISANFSFERGWPVPPGAYPVYASVYLLVPLSFFMVRSGRYLRRYFMSSWLLIGLASLFYPAFPFVPEPITFAQNSFMAALPAMDIRLDAPPVCVCPSYHVAWAFLAAFFSSRERSPYFKTAAFIWAALVFASCVTTSRHALIDAFGGALAALLVINASSIWRYTLSAAEKLANSWREYLFLDGRVRVLNHAFYGALAGGAGLGSALILAGTGHAYALFGAGLAAMAGAGLWGQWLEGSSKLQRPFGYFGGLFGLILGLVLLACLRESGWLTAGAAMASAPAAQAAGRLRCLVQGCCHGREVASGHHGIRVLNRHSRVAQISNLAGAALYPTQVYSILGNLIISALLWRAWTLNAPLALICGLYLILAGAARFMEEAWRGETQTTKLCGLPIYQWLAIMIIAGGFFISTLPSPPAPALQPGFSYASAALTITFAALCGLAMGVDFPLSKRRFARLSG